MRTRLGFLGRLSQFTIIILLILGLYTFTVDGPVSVVRWFLLNQDTYATVTNVMTRSAYDEDYGSYIEYSYTYQYDVEGAVYTGNTMFTMKQLEYGEQLHLKYSDKNPAKHMLYGNFGIHIIATVVDVMFICIVVIIWKQRKRRKNA